MAKHESHESKPHHTLQKPMNQPSANITEKDEIDETASKNPHIWNKKLILGTVNAYPHRDNEGGSESEDETLVPSRGRVVGRFYRDGEVRG